MGDLKLAMEPSTPILESVRLLESASLGILDLAERIEDYLPEAEAALTEALRDRGHDPAAAAAGAAADRMLAGLRHMAGPRGHMPQRSTIPTSTAAPTRGNFTQPAPARSAA